MKKCFNCGNKLPHFLFDKREKGAYQRPSDKGLATNCKVCNYRQAIKQGGIFYKWEAKWKKNHPTIPASKLFMLLFYTVGRKTKIKLIKKIYNE